MALGTKIIESDKFDRHAGVVPLDSPSSFLRKIQISILSALSLLDHMKVLFNVFNDPSNYFLLYTGTSRSSVSISDFGPKAFFATALLGDVMPAPSSHGLGKGAFGLLRYPLCPNPKTFMHPLL